MNIFQTVLMYIVWALSTYFVVLFLLLIFKYKDTLFEEGSASSKEQPTISILVPAYNEEATIKDTIASLSKIDYPKDKLQIIVINDGSKDKTSSIVRTLQKKTGFTFIDNKINKGKAGSLNQGIKAARGKFVVCMDADTRVPRNILRTVVRHFTHSNVGAVTVAIDVKPKNLLQKITEIEYAVGLSLSLSILSRLGSMHVTPGPFTMFRKSMLEEIGGFDEKNITEDLEIAYRIQKAGYRLKCCLNAKVHTEVPRTIKTLYRQRKRWYTGSLQTLAKHRDVVFNKDLGFFGYFIPFNFALIFIGLFFFLFSTGMTLYNTFRNLSFFRHTDFNFLSHLKYIQIDILSIFNIFTILIIFSTLMTVLLGFIGMSVLRKSLKSRIVSFIGFIYLFLLYQAFWLSSIYSFISKRKVQWR